VRTAAARYLPLLGATALSTALAQAASRVPLHYLGHLAEDSPAKFRLVRLGMVALVVAVQALFVYSVPGIVAGRRRLGPAVGGSLRLAVRQPLATYLIVGVPALLELVPAWLARQGHVIAVSFTPELLLGVMLVWIAMILLASYATIGAATRLFIHSTEDGVADAASAKEA